MFSPDVASPTNRKFLRPKATRRSARSEALLSSGMRTSSRKRPSSTQSFKPYLMAIPIGLFGS